jgi:hypothetical protein
MPLEAFRRQQAAVAFDRGVRGPPLEGWSKFIGIAVGLGQNVRHSRESTLRL